MIDTLKDFIENNHEGFKETPPADVWTNIESGLKQKNNLLKSKKLSTMLKYGFGASALIIGTYAFFNLNEENTISSVSTIAENVPTATANIKSPNPKYSSANVAVSTSTDPVKTNAQSTKANNLIENKVFTPDTIDPTAMPGVGSAAPNSYTVWTDMSTGNMGAACKSLDKKIKGFASGMLSTMPDEYTGISDLPKKYLGKRIRFSAYVKTENVAEWVGLWVWVGKKGGKEALAFDNMRYGKKDRAIRGTTPWTKYEVVLDVPMNASNIIYGTMIAGTGEMRVHTILLEIVDTSVPVTAELQTSYPGVQESDRYRSYHPNDFWKWYVPGHTVLPDGTWQVDYRGL